MAKLNKVNFQFDSVESKQQFVNKLAGIIFSSKNAAKTANLYAKAGMLVTVKDTGEVGVYCPISYNGKKQLRAVQASAYNFRGKVTVETVNRPVLPKIATVAQRTKKVESRNTLVEGLRSCR